MHDQKFINHVYGNMSDDELLNYHQNIQSSLRHIAGLANDGDHQFDHLAPVYEYIIEDTESLISDRRKQK